LEEGDKGGGSYRKEYEEVPWVPSECSMPGGHRRCPSVH